MLQRVSILAETGKSYEFARSSEGEKIASDLGKTCQRERSRLIATGLVVRSWRLVMPIASSLPAFLAVQSFTPDELEASIVTANAPALPAKAASVDAPYGNAL